jgi:hypothetical protein
MGSVREIYSFSPRYHLAAIQILIKCEQCGMYMVMEKPDDQADKK